MSLQWVSSQLQLFLTDCLNSFSYPLAVGLYTNSFAPDCNAVLSDFTEVTGDPGYSRGVISSSSSLNPSVENCVGTAVTQAIPFGFSNTETIYGYFILDSTGALLAAEELSGGPYTISAGVPIQLTITLNFGSCP